MRLRSASGKPISLRALLPGAAFAGANDIAVDACWADPCRVEPGALFVALAKTGRDRHGSISEAMRCGCGAVLLQHRDPEISVPACFVPDVREAYGRLCHALAGNPSRQMKIIGVTGVGGRTTVSCLIASILNSVGQKIGVLGRLGCLDGREVCSLVRSIPPTEDLADILARMVANGCSHAVLDVSGTALGKRRAEGVQFDAACVTGLRRNRNGKNDPLWNGRGTGPRLLDFLAPEGFVVINADDPGSVGCLSEIDGPVLTVGLRVSGGNHGKGRGAGRRRASLPPGGGQRNHACPHVDGRCPSRPALPHGGSGRFGLRDRAREDRAGLEAVDYVPGCLQRIDCGQSFGVFVDDARTPNALAAALRALRPLTSGRLMCVFSAGEGDPSLCSRMGRAAERFADLSRDYRREPANPHIADRLAGHPQRISSPGHGGDYARTGRGDRLGPQ